jgi:CubicO group peptidase (beta-lactamase class C family)
MNRRQAAIGGALAAFSAFAPRAGAAEGLDGLAAAATASGSDAVLVYHKGRRIFEYYSGKPEPIFLMSCVKSIVGLAIGQALAEGKIKSLDQPLYDFFPELKQGRKQQLTVRHLLNMTSGIQNIGTGPEVYAAPDYVRLALAAELTTAPGAAFNYNNKSVQLLSGIVPIACGQPLDDYVRDRFFWPMGIESWDWLRDRAGHASAMADLALFPEDFAKFGALVLQKGQWDGKPLVPESWTQLIGQQSQPYEPLYGLLWWRIPTASSGVLTRERVAELARAGASKDLLDLLAPLAGRTFGSLAAWHRALAEVSPDWQQITTAVANIHLGGLYGDSFPVWRYDGFDGLVALGYLGQHLVIYPSRELVAVRMIKDFDAYQFIKNRFEDFPDLVRGLAPVS